MEVEVTGTPEPTISWHKDNRPVESVLHAGYRMKHQGNCHTLIVDKGLLKFVFIKRIKILNKAKVFKMH